MAREVITLADKVVEQHRKTGLPYRTLLRKEITADDLRTKVARELQRRSTMRRKANAKKPESKQWRNPFELMLSKIKPVLSPRLRRKLQNPHGCG